MVRKTLTLELKKAVREDRQRFINLGSEADGELLWAVWCDGHPQAWEGRVCQDLVADMLHIPKHRIGLWLGVDPPVDEL